MERPPAIRLLVLVEGESDAAAVRALTRVIGVDLGDKVLLQSADGVTNYSRVLSGLVQSHPTAAVCGLYDVADERHVRRALSVVGAWTPQSDSLEALNFFACVLDLEDELIRALGPESVERVIEAEGELPSLRRFQAMPQHRGTPVHQQLRRFLGTRATRKIRSARRLVEGLSVEHLPPPLRKLANVLRESSGASTH